MRFNGKELAAVALQPSHKFDKEGVLLIKEKQDGLFRRGEVYVPRFCRLRGNLLFYFKSTDLCSEPVGVFVLEQCVVSLDVNNVDGPYCFNLVFDGDKVIQKFMTHTECDRDSWIQVLHMASYQYMCSQLRTLQEKLSSFNSNNEPCENNIRSARSKSMLDSNDEYFLEMSLACDNLMCDGNGTAPNPMLSISVMTPPENQWSSYSQTEILERSSNPCFLTTVGFRSSDNITPVSKVKISAHDVCERLTLTMTLLGSTVFTIAQLLEAEKNKLRLTLMSTTNMTVGFVSVTAWQIESDTTNTSTSSQVSSSDAKLLTVKSQSQTLSAKLTCKSRISQHNQLNVLYDNAISQTYRFHTGLGADLSVLEIMAENKLSFAFPQSLLVLFIKEEKDMLSNMAQLGELKQPWNDRQVEEIDQRLHLINSYTQALTYLDSYTGPNFKASTLKSDSNLEFVPLNLHLQRMWIQNETTKKSGFYDVVTVGAFAAHSLKFKNGGLLKLISQCSANSRFNKHSNAASKSANVNNNNNHNNNISNKLNQAATTATKIKNLRQELKILIDRMNHLAQRKASSELQIVMTDVTNLAEQITQLCEPALIEEAYHVLEDARLPQNNNDATAQCHASLQRAMDDTVTLSPARLLSSNSSPIRLTVSARNSLEKDDEAIMNSVLLRDDEKCDDSKECHIRRIQHRRSSSDARLYSEFNAESVDADRHSLFNIRISEEEASGDRKSVKSSSPTLSLSRKLGWRLQKHLKDPGIPPPSRTEGLSIIESNSMLNLFRKAGNRSRHERSMINIGRSDSNSDSNKGELRPLCKCKKTMSLRSLNGSKLRSRSPDEPEPWDLTQLNIEASVMCMASKVKTLCLPDHEGGKGTTSATSTSAETANSTSNATDVDWVDELRPSMMKLQQALDCLLKTSRLVHCLFILQESSECATLQSLTRYRRDVAFSQALTALVSAVMTKLWCHRLDQEFVNRMCELGILAEFEGLLSCYGDEMGMLEDMVVAIEDLKQVKFKLITCEHVKKVVPQVDGTRSSLRVHLPVPDSIFTSLSTEQRKDCEFRVTPVFLNVGINEQASFAEKKTSCMQSFNKKSHSSSRFGDVSLQDKINMSGVERLTAFYKKYQALPIKTTENKRNLFNDYHSSIDKAVEKLNTLVNTRKSKNIEILHVAAQICRQLNGLRFISCKSAKDRTSMSVTLEQCAILQEQFDLAEPEFSHALDCMRCEGTRRENTLKNAGVMKYAFNSLQLMALPKLYRPPPGTYGNVQT